MGRRALAGPPVLRGLQGAVVIRRWLSYLVWAYRSRKPCEYMEGWPQRECGIPTKGRVTGIPMCSYHASHSWPVRTWTPEYLSGVQEHVRKLRRGNEGV